MARFRGVTIRYKHSLEHNLAAVHRIITFSSALHTSRNVACYTTEELSSNGCSVNKYNTIVNVRSVTECCY